MQEDSLSGLPTDSLRLSSLVPLAGGAKVETPETRGANVLSQTDDLALLSPAHERGTTGGQAFSTPPAAKFAGPKGGQGLETLGWSGHGERQHLSERRY